MAEAGKIKVEQGVLTMLAGANPSFSLIPAYRIVRTTSESPDSIGLVGQVRTEQELKEIGAEVYMDSVIYKDTAYQADPGFIAEERIASDKPEDKKDTQKDQKNSYDDLSKFILDNLIK